jgi:hypothetical protein
MEPRKHTQELYEQPIMAVAEVYAWQAILLLGAKFSNCKATVLQTIFDKCRHSHRPRQTKMTLGLLGVLCGESSGYPSLGRASTKAVSAFCL